MEWLPLVEKLCSEEIVIPLSSGIFKSLQIHAHKTMPFLILDVEHIVILWTSELCCGWCACTRAQEGYQGET